MNLIQWFKSLQHRWQLGSLFGLLPLEIGILSFIGCLVASSFDALCGVVLLGLFVMAWYGLIGFIVGFSLGLAYDKKMKYWILGGLTSMGVYYLIFIGLIISNYFPKFIPGNIINYLLYGFVQDLFGTFFVGFLVNFLIPIVLYFIIGSLIGLIIGIIKPK
jgi:hypothetical protein